MIDLVHLYRIGKPYILEPFFIEFNWLEAKAKDTNYFNCWFGLDPPNHKVNSKWIVLL